MMTSSFQSLKRVFGGGKGRAWGLGFREATRFRGQGFNSRLSLGFWGFELLGLMIWG